MREVNRREFLRMTGLSAAATLVSMAGADPSRSVAGRGDGFVPDLEIALRATQKEVSLFSGTPTRVWAYEGEVLKGSPSNLQVLPDSYLGPTIRVRRGQKLRVRFINDLSEPSIIHWHGLHLPPEMDAHPRYAIGPGRTYVYEFEVTNRAGTYWYHPHPHRRTGPQVYNGLAGLLYVSDDEEEHIGLPSDEYDIPLVIQDRTFDSGNQLVYEQGGMMGGFAGFLGDRILVNGRPDFRLSVAARSYRFRLVNGSNSRIYKLAWSDETPLVVIATDGGLLESPVRRDYVMLAPGERVELLADFKGRKGARPRLVSLGFSAMGGGGMGGGQALPNGSPFSVVEVQVRRKKKESFSLPDKLSDVVRYRREDAINGNNPRVFAISSGMMTWLLNGRSFEMDGVADNEIVRLGTLEVWELVNESGAGGMGGMSMVHPIHIHGVQFQVLERRILPQFLSAWETVRLGYVDGGWKDTVMLMPGERVKLLLKFEDYEGFYLYHCHNLEHEDRGMMRNYEVRA